MKRLKIYRKEKKKVKKINYSEIIYDIMIMSCNILLNVNY